MRIPYWVFQLQVYPWIPYLIYKAKQVRKSRPKLPSQSALLTLGDGANRLLLLGESTVEGVGASSPTETIAGNFYRLFGKSYQIETLGKNGLMVKDVLTFFKNHQQASENTYTGILIFLGANDCFHLTHPAVFKKEMEALIKQLLNTTSAQWIYVANIPPVNQFPAFSKIIKSFLGEQRNYLNMELEKIASRVPEVIYKDSPIHLNADMFSADGIHPSNLGYQKMAELAFESLQVEKS